MRKRIFPKMFGNIKFNAELCTKLYPLAELI